MLAFEKDEFNLTFVLDSYQRINDSIKLSNNKKHFNFIKELYESFGINLMIKFIPYINNVTLAYKMLL